MIKTPSLIAHYPFEGNANDALGGADLTVSGAVLATGRMGKCYSLNGSTDVLSNSTANILTGLSAITICAWVNTSSTKSQGNTVCSYIGNSSPYNGFTLNIGRNTAGRLAYYNSSVGTWREATSTNYNSGSWVHIAVVDNGSNIYFYKNGVLDGTLASSALNFQDQIIRIGYERVPAPRVFDGLIDEVSFFNKALNQTDIRRIMIGLHPLN